MTSKKNFYEKYGYKWYTFLKQQQDGNKYNYLMSSKEGNNKFIICKQLKYRSFAYVESSNKLKKLINETSDNERCYYEVVLGDKPRKLYFDLDCEIEKIDEKLGDDEEMDYIDYTKEMVKKLKKAIISEISEKLDKEVSKIKKNIIILVYSSNTSKKFSYHIVVYSYYVRNNIEARIFYEEVMKRMGDEYEDFIDPKVYSKVQQFRVVGCIKYGKNNKKVLSKSLTHNYELLNEKVDENEKEKHKQFMFSSSLLGNISDSKYLGGYEEIAEKRIKKMQHQGNASEEDAEDVMKLVDEAYPDVFELSESKLNEYNNLLMIFRRINPYECNICKREHEHENAFCIVLGIERKVLFSCRRSKDDDYEELGSLGYKPVSMNTKKEITQEMYNEFEEIKKKLTPTSAKKLKEKIEEKLENNDDEDSKYEKEEDKKNISGIFRDMKKKAKLNVINFVKK